MVVIGGCCRQHAQQVLQTFVGGGFLQLDVVAPPRSWRSHSSGKLGSIRRSSTSSAGGVVMSLLLVRPSCSISVTASSEESKVRVGRRNGKSGRWSRRLTVCMVAERNAQRRLQQEQKLVEWQSSQQRMELSPCLVEEELTEEEDKVEMRTTESAASEVSVDHATISAIAEKKRKDRKRERTAYLFAALASSVGFVTLAAVAVYYRFVWQMQDNVEVPYGEMLGTFSLAIGAAVGMEFWARWAHKALWHASLWNMHESHHQPREGPFELNDIFAIINAVPAIALMAIGFFNRGFIPGLCFGGGLGITMFGMAYMFVHDGLVHRRFTVGPIADFPYLQKVAAAHQLHHADLFGGVPYGLFLGPKELEDVGGQDELQKVLNLRYKIRDQDN